MAATRVLGHHLTRHKLGIRTNLEVIFFKADHWESKSSSDRLKSLINQSNSSIKRSLVVSMYIRLELCLTLVLVISAVYFSFSLLAFVAVWAFL